MEVLVERSREYPFLSEMYAMTRNRSGEGGLEHQTNASTAEDHDSENVIIHESAHQW